MACFVYYDDDYADNGGIGLAEFEDSSTAAAFIESRMSSHPDPKLENYTVIDGRKMNLSVREQITRVVIQSPPVHG